MAETKWTNEQWEAITARDCNLLVAAAAGAGKTAVLVERIIGKITNEENLIDIDRLLVVTFTNAAATEMRERIAEAISAALEKQPENKNIQRQLTLLNKASITTIHSFCLEVIRSNFQSIDIDPGFRICDETEAVLMKLEILNEMFEELYEDQENNVDFFRLLECYGGNRDDQVIQDMVLNLYSFIQSSPWPDQWLEQMTEQFHLPNHSLTSDFGSTPWGEILLLSVRMELEGLRRKMSKALEILREQWGLDNYLPVFEEEFAFINRIHQLCDSESSTKWDDVYAAMHGLSFNRLPSAGKEADKDKQEYVKDLRDDVKKGLNKIKDRFFTADSEGVFEDLQRLYPLLLCLQRLVREFGKKYRLKKSEKSLVDFNDLEHFCLEILTQQDEDGEYKPSHVAMGYKERFAEILVDEYQDSNLVQEIIIRMISKGDSERPNVFMVGDVKQSIYRFRQAKPELFLEKYHSYSLKQEASYRKILLFKNFRSRKEVIDGVNFLFKQMMSLSVGELDYTEEEALNPGAAFPENSQEDYRIGGEVEFHLIQTKAQKTNVPGQKQDHERDKDSDDWDAKPGGESEDRDNDEQEKENGEDDLLLDAEMLDNIQCEARLVARRIKELVKPDTQGKCLAVYDRNRKEYRNVEYRDMVILLRTTKNWADVFSEELAAEGIPAFADTGSGFFKTSEVQVVLSLLQLIDNPLQDIPLLAVLRSPLGSFTTDELAELRLIKRKGPLFEALQALAEEQGSSAQVKAVDFLQALQKWRELAMYLSTDQLLWQIYTATGYYGIVGAMPAGGQRQANLRILFERARAYEETSFKGLFNFINFIDKLKSSKSDMGSAKILGENDNVVRIMSIHKSKGLEFPVVILSGCGKKFNLQDMNKSILLHQDLGFGPDVVDPDLRISYPSLAKQAIREKIKTETLSEEMRILYVALTRAREKLIITGAVSDIPKALGKWSACAEAKEERIPPSVILQGEKYLDWIAPAILRHPLSGLSSLAQTWPDDPSVWSTRLWRKDEITNRSDDESLAEDALESWFAEIDSAETNHAENDPAENESAESFLSRELREELLHMLKWEYPYAKMTKVPAKISVTELKRRFEEEEAAEQTFDVLDNRPLDQNQSNFRYRKQLKMKKPLFLEGKKGLSSAEKGTVMHFVMQHLEFRPGDLTGEDIDEQLREMVARDLLTREQAKTVDSEKIGRFLTSSVGQRMLKAKLINREVPFNIEIPCQEAYHELDGECYQGESVLLQGVIDCYFEEADGIVLVDYKTDHLTEGWEATMKDRYKLQISYYARALEMLTGKVVKEKYIYLFQNGEVVEV